MRSARKRFSFALLLVGLLALYDEAIPHALNGALGSAPPRSRRSSSHSQPLTAGTANQNERGVLPGVTVTFSSSRIDFHADSGQYSSQFTVTKTSAGTENFTFSCIGSTYISCQGESPQSFQLNGVGASVDVIVFWNALSIGGSASQSATITLAAEGAGSSFGQGSKTLTLWQKAPGVFAISPTLAVRTPNPVSASTDSVTFQVRNVGTTTESIFPTCLTSASVQCISHSLTGASFAPFDPVATDKVIFQTTATATGQFLEDEIRLIGGTKVAGGRYTFDVDRNTALSVSVTPDGGPALARQENSLQTIPFTVTNTGTLAASFKLDVVGCSGSAFPSPSTCVITSPSGGLTGSLAQNASSAVTVSFNTLNARHFGNHYAPSAAYRRQHWCVRPGLQRHQRGRRPPRRDGHRALAHTHRHRQ